MRPLHRRRRQPEHEPLPATPRAAALDLLREKIGADQAGLDPWDKTIFILQARDTEQVWARRALELCGIVVDQTSGGRFRAILEADIRQELGLDTAGRALMLDEPLASRGIAGISDEVVAFLTGSEGEPGAELRDAPTPRDASSRAAAPTEAGASPSDTSHADALMDATLRALEPEPVSLPALREAKAAYDRRNT